MLLFRCMPPLPPANGQASRLFRSKWGRENCIISARAARAEQPHQVQPLSIRAAWGGVEHCFVDNRRVAVDDDGYLILNDSRECASLIESDRPVHSFSVFFRPGFADEVLGCMLTPRDHILERGVEPVRKPFEFAEHLRPHDRIVTPVLHYICRYVELGVDDELWYAEQLSFLLERMLQSHRDTLAAVQRLPLARNSTRREIYRRIGLATDFIHENYARKLTIDALAAAAHISKYHFVRLFHAVHGTTPYAFLQEKRARVASRLLGLSDGSLDQIAIRVGFDNRVTLFRHLRRITGCGGSALRRSAREAART